MMVCPQALSQRKEINVFVEPNLHAILATRSECTITLVFRYLVLLDVSGLGVYFSRAHTWPSTVLLRAFRHKNQHERAPFLQLASLPGGKGREDSFCKDGRSDLDSASVFL